MIHFADSPQRSSSVCKTSGRASPRAWGAEKENDPRDAAGGGSASARTHKVRSSGVSAGGGGGGVAKSFMAPTISAASKAVAPSATPRKKVLGERNNDPVPSSPVDLAHSGRPRGAHPPPPPEEALGAPRRLRLSLDAAPAPPPAAGPVVSRGVRSFGGDEAAVKVENAVSENDHHHHAAASADAEAVAAPYDPKTNYLSPRPRYLRYQPNRHLEIYRHGCGAVRGLEDRFASESSSEEVGSGATEEDESAEEQPDDCSEEETSALAPQSEARAQSAAPALDGVLLPQPSLDSPLARVLTPEDKESPRAGGVLIPEQEAAASPARARPKKKRSSMRFLLAPLALVLFMAAAFVCVPPPPGHPVMLNTSLSKVSDFLSVQELHPVELAARLKQWSSSSLDFVTSYWEAIASYQEPDVFGPYLATNLSAAAADVDADYAVGFYYSAAQTSSISLEELEIQEVVSESYTEMIAGPDVEELAAYDDPDAEPIDDIEMEQEDVSGVPSAMEEVNVDAVAEEFDAEMAEEVSGSSGEEMAAFIQNSDIPSQSTPEPEQAEGTDEVSLQQDVQTEDSEGDHADGKEDQEAQHGQKLGSDMLSSYLDKISDPAAIGAALAGIIIAAAVAYLYMRQKQTRVASIEPADQVEQIEQVEKVGSLSGSGSSQGHVVAKGSLFSPGVEETERFGGSGPSQYSSSLSSGLGRRRRNTKGEDALGIEPEVSRRDSTAQSTSSYGSFTTYQKIPAKKVSCNWSLSFGFVHFACFMSGLVLTCTDLVHCTGKQGRRGDDPSPALQQAEECEIS